jgi:tetratricopeptide (TPR) repeat protein
MFDMVDELTRRIKANFKLSAEEIAGDIDENVGKITTSSPEAFKYYSEGRKYINKGDDRQSLQLMQKAVAIDSGFAMAYRSLSASYANLAYGSEAGKSLQKAFELSNRVSERERYLIEGHFHGVREPNKAMTAFNKLLQLYPDDETGNLQLGWMYVLSEDWDKAIQQFDVNVRNKSEAYQSYVMQAYSYMANGAYQKAGEILEFYRRNVADTPVIHFFLAGNFLCQGKYDLALAEVDKSLSQASTLFHPLYLKGDIYHCQGDLIKAEIEYQRLLAREEAGAHGYGICRLATLCLLNGKFEKAISQHKRGSNLHLAYMYLKSGNPVQAFAVCDKAWESAVKSKDLFEQIGILHFKGVIDLEMGQLDRAQNAADTLKPMIERSLYAKRIRYYHHLMGMIELKRGNFSRAIENFQSAITLLPAQFVDIPPGFGLGDQTLFLDPLAWAYYQAGDSEKARAEYEKIIALNFGRIGYGDIFARSFYMLGKIYAAKGLQEKAKQHYTRFVELWKDCDTPFRPLVQEAKQRIELLEKKKAKRG